MKDQYHTSEWQGRKESLADSLYPLRIAVYFGNGNTVERYDKRNTVLPDTGGSAPNKFLGPAATAVRSLLQAEYVPRRLAAGRSHHYPSSFSDLYSLGIRWVRTLPGNFLEPPRKEIASLEWFVCTTDAPHEWPRMHRGGCSSSHLDCARRVGDRGGGMTEAILGF